MSHTALVDGHVHYYTGYDIRTFLDAAAANFRRGAEEHGLGAGAPRFLLLCEVPEMDFFRRLATSPPPVEDWSFEATDEPDSVHARSGDSDDLILVAGRQLPTREGLEVLALGYEKDLPSGLSLLDTVAAVTAVGAVPSIPWGFGKWWFSRRTLLLNHLSVLAERGVSLGDSGLRPRAAPRPEPLARAERSGILVLAGSDPLPLPGQEMRAGSFGFTLHIDYDEGHPVAALKRALRGQTTPPPLYGARVSLAEFVAAQLRMRVRRGRSSQQIRGSD